VVDAMRLRQLGLAGVADRADHGGAAPLGPLRRDHADAAGRGLDQHGVAGAQRPHPLEQHMGRQAAHQHCGGDVKADRIGQADGAVGRQQAVLGVAAGGQPGIGDAVALVEMIDARPDPLDRASALDA
jgi:hypothetical protein